MGVGGICLVLGREWENFLTLSLNEPEVTLRLFIFVSCPMRVCSTHLSFILFLYPTSVFSLVSAAKVAALPATGATVFTNIYTEKREKYLNFWGFLAVILNLQMHLKHDQSDPISYVK